MHETDIPCDKCGEMLVVRFSKRGPFLGCQNFPKCRGTKQLPPEMKEKLQQARPADKDEEKPARVR